MNIIEKEWEVFKEEVISKNAGPLQIEAMKLAFFSGATTIYYKTIELAVECEDEDKAMVVMDSIEKELINYKDDYLRRNHPSPPLKN